MDRRLATKYALRRREIARLLDWLEIEVGKHAEYVDIEGVTGDHVHQLGSVRQRLILALAKLSETNCEDTESNLSDAEAGRLQAESKSRS
jgi:hypothetical protein